MSNCCDRFVMIEGEEDSFETWQGLRGPYYTPHVDENGTLTWTNNGGLQNPADVNIKGPPGPGGVPGGTTGQLLAKASDEDYDTEWIDQPEMDAGHVSYDSTEAYDDGTVGKELTTINSALSSLSAVTEIIDTASGAIASFPDGSGLPMRSLLAQINPVQDLHGYANPWPAGGGKNLCALNDFTKTKRDVTFAYANGKLIVNGTPLSAGWFGVGETLKLPAGSYTVSYKVSGSNPVIKIGFDNFGGYMQFNTAGTLSRTFTLSEEKTGTLDLNTDQTAAYANTEILIQIESGSTATAWTPYSNICPVTGHTGLSVEVRGVNQWDEETQPGYYDATTGNYAPGATNQLCSKNFTPVKPNTQYVFQKAHNLGDILFYNSSKELIGRAINRPSNSVFTTPENCSFIKINLGSAYGNVYNHNVGINYPGTDTTYHAYTGTTTTVSWQDEAGTVYGGTLDVVSGVLTVDKAFVDLGTLTYDAQGSAQSGKYRMRSTGIASVIKTPATSGDFADIICSIYKTRSANNVYTCNEGISITSGGDISIYDSRYNTEDSVASFIQAMDGVQLVYALKTPITHQLTPQQVSTLLGQNNVWHDANGNTTVTYQASIKGYIDKVLGA